MTGGPIIVHDVEDVRAALASAADLGVGVVLLSAPGAAAYLGASVFRKMITEARRAHPAAQATAVLDCGGDAGLALNAMRHGVDAVKVDLPGEVRGRLKDIADQCNVVLYDDGRTVLDLSGVADARAACRAWLEGEGIS